MGKKIYIRLDYNGLTDLKMTAVSNAGTVEGYFDAYTIDASSPVSPANEYVYRTSVVDDFNTTSVFTFTPVADACVYQSSPTNNYGTSNLLRADGSPIMRIAGDRQRHSQSWFIHNQFHSHQL